MIPQFISCKLPTAGQRLSPWPGGSCLYHRQLMLPSADFQALGSHDYERSLPPLALDFQPLAIADPGQETRALMQAESS